jgi:hypothetical protein
MEILDKMLMIMSKKMEKLPQIVKVMVFIPVVILVSGIVMPIMLLGLLWTIASSPFQEKPTLSTPREIYKRTGIKVNGYSGYSN